MRAFRFEKWQQGASFQDVPMPEPGPGEVLIRIGGAGACHSDLHLMHEWTLESFPQLATSPLPFTLGHENAGWVEAGDLRGYEPGTPVVVSPTWTCGRCQACREGATNYCDQKVTLTGGLGRDGGMAEYMVAPVTSLVPLGDLEPWQAAPLSDAGLTSYHAVKRCLPNLVPGTTAVVIGVGGLGHLGVAYLRQLSGARIIAVDREASALEMAREFGADLCLPSDDTTAELIREATDGLGANAILDFVGTDATLAMAAETVRKRAQIVVVGLGGGVLPFQFGALPHGCSIVTTMAGSTAELGEIVALARAGRVMPRVQRFALEDATSVFEQLKANEISGRAVMVP